MHGVRPLLGIGIDTVSWARMKHFLKEHSLSTLKRLLTPLEQNHFLSTSDRLSFFARSWAAKEAYFKALGGSWMGEEGFRAVEVILEGRKSFRIRGAYETEGTFTETVEGLNARVLVWQRP